MKPLHALPLAVAAVLAGTSGWADTRVALGDLPSAVRATVKEQSRGATMRGLSKEVDQGRTVYEVELRANGHDRDVTIDESGAVVAIEEEVRLDSVPPAARAAIERGASGGTIRKVEATTKGNAVVEYEASVQKHGGKRLEVHVNPDGTPAAP